MLSLMKSNGCMPLLNTTETLVTKPQSTSVIMGVGGGGGVGAVSPDTF